MSIVPCFVSRRWRGRAHGSSRNSAGSSNRGSGTELCKGGLLSVVLWGCRENPRSSGTRAAILFTQRGSLISDAEGADARLSGEKDFPSGSRRRKANRKGSTPDSPDERVAYSEKLAK
ncbi:hypothetical protein HPB47_003044 [Ixodes persulcatus]|uniref:Uncharacterized protein n=1 Tax=Ixodes persulcatus TaxID=34615 RepID=A0AC60PKQ3_IXOPE|nr:hypothetical protein HPB47_003044 [Ixodes persulcatus]